MLDGKIDYQFWCLLVRYGTLNVLSSSQNISPSSSKSLGHLVVPSGMSFIHYRVLNCSQNKQVISSNKINCSIRWFCGHFNTVCLVYIAGFSDNDEDEDDDGSQSVISTAASSRVSTAKSRASSARLTTLSRTWSGAAGSSKPSSSVSSKKTNAWGSSADEDKQEKLPALTPSLFAHVPSTVYFFVEGEKGT